MSRYIFTKSKILSGIQCPKRLYLELFCPELAEKSKGNALSDFIGIQAGKVARGLFPNGKLIQNAADPLKAVEETEWLLTQSPGLPVFEAAFSHEGVLIRSDIFLKGKKGYRLIEVKAATNIKDSYLFDCAIQAWVIEGAGYPLESVELAYVNNNFIYKGDGDYKGLFCIEEFTEAIAPIKEKITGWLKRFQKVLDGQIPEKGIGNHCKRPFICPFQSYCFPEPPEYPVTSLPYGSKMIIELLNEGIRDIRDIPPGRLIKDIHKKVHRSTLSGKPELDATVGEYLQGLPYPRYYLDFETISFAAPIWSGTRPYQQLPFQWSCHIEDQPGDIKHVDFISISDRPPMRLFVEKLLETLADHGPVFVYNQAFEKRILMDLSGTFIDLAQPISAVIGRIVDLLPLVRKHYYHPQMKGSWSIKTVLPTIAKDLNYKDLPEVQDGITAQLAYYEIIQPGTSELRRDELMNKMKEYCKMDTYALVTIAEFFQSNVEGPGL